MHGYPEKTLNKYRAARTYAEKSQNTDSLKKYETKNRQLDPSTY